MNAPIPQWAMEASRQVERVDTELDAQWNAQIIANAHACATQTVTCVMCGMEYPPGTPTSQAEVLNAHIRVCEKHPMRQVEADKAKLRAALATLVGVDTKEELEQMEAVIRLSPAPAADKAGIIDAIHALLATL